GDLIAHGMHRVERSHRLLEDHRDFGASDLSHLLRVELGEIPTLEENAAGGNLAWIIDQPHDAEGGDAFATARLSNETHDLAGLDRERDAIDRSGQSAAEPKLGLETLDAQQRRARSNGHADP